MKYMILLSFISFTTYNGNHLFIKLINIYHYTMVFPIISISVLALKCYKCNGQKECANLDDTKFEECTRSDDGCRWDLEDCRLPSSS